eukprot:m.231615 g.231615  ORF g.231615 m.231615 type:complete len:277 (-) comp18420_c0_seq1:25-855(-)
MALRLTKILRSAATNRAVLLDIDAHGVATITLNRPDAWNTFSDEVIATLHESYAKVRATSGLRALFLRANGKFFCAGADLKWMQRTADYTPEQNKEDAYKLGLMLKDLDSMPLPTVALVQGPAFGGGVGLVSCCDVAVAVSTATFTLSEVKLGLLPAVISPYVVARIGVPQARRYFLTAEKIEAPRAREIGLVHEVVADEAALNAHGDSLRSVFLQNSPTAIAAAKSLISRIAGRGTSPEVLADTAATLASQRASAEGREGLSAFFGKRKAAWVKQ